MDARQCSRRQEILQQIRSILDGQGKSGEGSLPFMDELTRELEALARNVDATTGDRLERARNWRYLGNAHFDVGAGADPARLAQAVEAYKNAELLLMGIESPVEKAKLYYSYGRALFGLSRRSNYWMVEESRQKFLQALELAEMEWPEAVGPIRCALEASDQVINLLKKRKEIYRRIAELKHRETVAETKAPEPVASSTGESDLFELLIANYHGTSMANPVSKSNHAKIAGLLHCL